MTARVVLANGIRTMGEGNVDYLRDELRLRGIEVVDVCLPKRNVITARWAASHDGYLLIAESRPGDVIVGHSFGAFRAAYAARVVPYKAIFTIAPAMPSRFDWGNNAGRVINYYSPDDRALRASRLLLLHPFGGGSGGLRGFDQVDPRRQYERPGYDHNDYFTRGLSQLAGHVERVCRS